MKETIQLEECRLNYIINRVSWGKQNFTKLIRVDYVVIIMSVCIYVSINY